MLKSCNPGSWLEVRGNFEIAGGDDQHVLDRDTLERITLADLLKSFRHDPSDPVLGRLRITIVPEAVKLGPPWPIFPPEVTHDESQATEIQEGGPDGN